MLSMSGEAAKSHLHAPQNLLDRHRHEFWMLSHIYSTCLRHLLPNNLPCHRKEIEDLRDYYECELSARDEQLAATRASAQVPLQPPDVQPSTPNKIFCSSLLKM
jgi:hypothetical protein